MKANAQTKTWQRVCLFQPATDRQTGRNKNTERTTAVWHNGGYGASDDSLVVGSSAVLRLNFCAKNPPLPQAAKRNDVILWLSVGTGSGVAFGTAIGAAPEKKE